MFIETLLYLFGFGFWDTGLEILLPEKTESYIQEFSPLYPQWEGFSYEIFSPYYTVKEVDSMNTVFGKNQMVPVPMASTTKVMTALIILENHDLDEVVTISRGSNYTEGSTMSLIEGEKITVEALLYGLLLKSGNDSAIALAKYHSGSVLAFVDEMNIRADELFLKNTHFQNPHGLDAVGHYSSADDLASLGKVALQLPKFRQIVQTKEATVSSTNDEHTHFLQNTNQLLEQGWNVYGMKTGTTQNAGQCLLLLAEDSNGKEYIVVILGSTDRYRDAKSLLYWLQN